MQAERTGEHAEDLQITLHVPCSAVHHVWVVCWCIILMMCGWCAGASYYNQKGFFAYYIVCVRVCEWKRVSPLCLCTRAHARKRVCTDFAGTKPLQQGGGLVHAACLRHEGRASGVSEVSRKGDT